MGENLLRIGFIIAMEAIGGSIPLLVESTNYQNTVPGTIIPVAGLMIGAVAGFMIQAVWEIRKGRW